MPATAVLDKQGLVRTLISTGLWRFFPFLILYSIGLATIFPVLPGIVTNAFASEAAGHDIDCQKYEASTAPVECRNAHSTAVSWSAWMTFFSNTLLNFFCAPLVGSLSDQYGRKVFMLIGIAFQSLPIMIIKLYLLGLVPIYWYYPITAVNGLISSFNMCIIAVADLMPQEYRAISVAFMTSCFSVGILVGPNIGGYISTASVITVCLASIACSWVYVALFVHECAPMAKRRSATARLLLRTGSITRTPMRAVQGEVDAMEGGLISQPSARPGDGNSEREPLLQPAEAEGISHDGIATKLAEAGIAGSADIPHGQGHSDKLAADPQDGYAQDTRQPVPVMFQRIRALYGGWAIIKASTWYQKLLVIYIIQAVLFESVQTMLMQYLQLTLSFATADQAQLLTVLGIGGLLAKSLLLIPHFRRIGEQAIMFIGLSAFLSQALMLCFADSKLFALAAISIGSISALIWPAILGLQSSRVHPDQQGALQGTISGISSLASGCGPLLFARVFAAFTRSDSDLPYLPQAVWYIAAAFVTVAMVMTCLLNVGERKQNSEPTAHATAGPAAGDSTTEPLLA